jgi:hypothetical protein
MMENLGAAVDADSSSNETDSSQAVRPKAPVVNPAPGPSTESHS